VRWRLDGCPTFASAYVGRKRRGIALRTLLPCAQTTVPERTVLEWSKSIRKHRFRPMYAGANPDFLLRGVRHDRVCGFLHGKPHEARQRHQSRQEIRGTWGTPPHHRPRLINSDFLSYTNSERPTHARPAAIYNENERSLSSITFAPAFLYSGVRPMA
jgi:hypothetical protein